MATMRGRAEFSRYMAELEKKLTRLARGAGRAGGDVIADEARRRSVSGVVAQHVKVRTKRDGERVIVRVGVPRGKSKDERWAYSLGRWQEWGTRPHFISVGDEQRGGLGIRRINTKVNEADGNGSLVISGKFVGPTVFHPGAEPHPFLRTSRENKFREAITAGQGYINARIRDNGGPPLDDEDEA